MIYKCYKWRLNQNDCLNRGYILDGYPKKYADAVELFMGLPPVEEGEEPDENAQKIVETKLIPDKYIFLEMADGQIMARIQNLSEGEVEGTHLDEKTMKRRLKIFRSLNDPTTGD